MSKSSAAKDSKFSIDLEQIANLSKSDIPLTEGEQERISNLIHEKTGIYLGAEKAALIHSRISKRLRSLGLKSFTEYLNYLQKHKDEEQNFINVLTTNKTGFFRESVHFDFIKNEFLPEFIKKNPERNLKAWSAAGSTGQEAYTLAIVLQEFAELNGGLNSRILMSDVDTEVLARAESGVFNEESVQDIPLDMRRKYFLRGTGRNDGFYKADARVRDLIKFRQFNLIQDKLPDGVLFDIIFLRNVLIYFQKDTIEKVISYMHSRLNSGGCLILGLSESLNGIKHDFQLFHSAIYVKRP